MAFMVDLVGFTESNTSHNLVIFLVATLNWTFTSHPVLERVIGSPRQTGFFDFVHVRLHIIVLSCDFGPIRRWRSLKLSQGVRYSTNRNHIETPLHFQEILCMVMLTFEQSN